MAFYGDTWGSVGRFYGDTHLLPCSILFCSELTGK